MKVLIIRVISCTQNLCRFVALHKVSEVLGSHRDESLGIKGASCFNLLFFNNANIPSLALGSLGLSYHLNGHIVHFRFGFESTDLHEISRIDEIGHALMRRRVHEASSLVARAFKVATAILVISK